MAGVHLHVHLLLSQSRLVGLTAAEEELCSRGRGVLLHPRHVAVSILPVAAPRALKGELAFAARCAVAIALGAVCRGSCVAKLPATLWECITTSALQPVGGC